MTGVWEVGHNAYGIEPRHVGPKNFPVLPKQLTDVVLGKPFLSFDPKSPDYFRIPVNGPLAKGGAGGALPGYIGAFAPGPAPKEGDWFSRLRGSE